jgi:hypothetical protein
MSAHHELLALFDQWRHLTESEGEAIRAATWATVSKCQDAKFKLQARIVLTTELLQAELAAAGLGQGEYDRQFRGIVAELIALEARNSEWLSDQRKRAEQANHELAQTSRNLRQVHRAYAPARQPNWHSYS